MLIYGFKRGDELDVIGVDIALIFLVDKLGGFFFNSEIDYPLEFFSPDFFSLDIQEVLNVFNWALKSNEIALEFLEFITEFTKCGLASLNLEALCISFDLNRIVYSWVIERFKDEFLVQDFGKLTTQLVSETHDQDFLWIKLDDSHQCFIKFEHTFCQKSDLMSLLGQLESGLPQHIVFQELFADLDFEFLDLGRH